MCAKGRPFSKNSLKSRLLPERSVRPGGSIDIELLHSKGDISSQHPNRRHRRARATLMLTPWIAVIAGEADDDERHLPCDWRAQAAAAQLLPVPPALRAAAPEGRYAPAGRRGAVLPRPGDSWETVFFVDDSIRGTLHTCCLPQVRLFTTS